MKASPLRRGCYWMRGRTYAQIYGPRRGSSQRRLRSLAHLGIKKSAEHKANLWKNRSRRAFGRIVARMKQGMTPSQKARRLHRFLRSLTPEIRRKIGNAHRGKLVSTATRSKQSAARSRRGFPFNRTKPENLVASFLRSWKLSFRRQVRPRFLKYHAFDFSLRNAKILIEVDGCWWHGCPTHYPERQKEQRLRDSAHTSSARKAGWKVVRLWEHEVLSGDFRKIVVAVRGRRRKCG